MGTRVTPPTGMNSMGGAHKRGTVAQGWVWRVDLLLAQVVEKQVAGRPSADLTFHLVAMPTLSVPHK